ncbi:hypothetical protein ABK040_005618 [Willaertia magna]
MSIMGSGGNTFHLASERWQMLEKERQEILRQRQLIENRIDLRYKNEEGLSHHKQDYYKRLLLKIEENLEKSKIRNKKLIAKTDETVNLISKFEATKVVKSQVKLEAAKKQFIEEIESKMKEYENYAREEKLRKIRMTEKKIEQERKRIRDSQLEWEREKVLNDELQNKVTELIVTKEKSKKELIEREAERKALLEEERKAQRIISQTSHEVSKKYMDQQEKQKKNIVDGKGSYYKNIINDVYDDSKEDNTIKFNENDLYYNDGYSSLEDKRSGSFAKFKEWQKKQKDLQENKTHKETSINENRDININNNNNNSHLSLKTTNNNSHFPLKTATSQPNIEKPKTESLLNRSNSSSEINIEKHKQGTHIIEEEEESSDSDSEPSIIEDNLSKTFMQAITRSSSPPNKRKSLESSRAPENGIKNNIPPKEPPQLKAPENVKMSTVEHEKKVDIVNKVEEMKKEKILEKSQDSTEISNESPKETTKLKSKLKGLFSFGFAKRKKSDSEETAGSASESDLPSQAKSDDSIVSQKLKKISLTKVQTSLDSLCKQVEDHLRKKQEEYKKLSITYKLKTQETEDKFIYLDIKRRDGKLRIKSIETPELEEDIEHKCLAILDIIKFYPSPLMTEEYLKKYLDVNDPEEYEMDSLAQYFKGVALEAWNRIVKHMNIIYKLEPKRREITLRIFTEVICYSVQQKGKLDETRTKVKTLLRNILSDLSKAGAFIEERSTSPINRRNISSSHGKIETLANESDEEEDHKPSNIIPIQNSRRPQTVPSSRVTTSPPRKSNLIGNLGSNPFSKLNKLINEDTSDSDMESILQKPRAGVTVTSGRSSMNHNPPKNNFQDDDLDF